MKHGIKYLGLILALIAVGCESEFGLNDNRTKKIHLTFEAYFNNTGQSKTEFSEEDSTKVLWSVGDSISLFYTANSFSSEGCFVSQNDEPSSFTSFRGSIEVASGSYEEGFTETPHFFAVYPYRKNNRCDGTGATIDIDSVQQGIAGSLPYKAFPAIARSENMNLAFYNVCSGIAFTLVNTNITYIELTANPVNGKRKAIAGRVRTVFDGGVPQIDEIVDSAFTVTFRPKDGNTFEAGKKYFLSLLPGTLENGVTLTFHTQTMKGEMNSDKAVTFNRGKFKQKFNIDEGLDFKVSVQSVEIKTDATELDCGNDYPFNVDFTPDYASDKRVKWASSDTTVAKVSEDGTVSAIGAGTCNIIVQSLDNLLACDTCQIECIMVHHLSRKDDVPVWANCYIIPEPGVYDLEVVRGVSGEDIGKATTAKVQWEYISSSSIAKKGNLIASVMIKNDKIRIITPEELTDGSASVAAVNAEGEIIWSWHIWINGGFDPEVGGQIYGDSTVVMDRNLGALSSKKSGPRALLYQWGRKDPFLPEYYPSKRSSVQWPSVVASSEETGTIEYTVKNPMTFLTAQSGYDWYYATDAQKTIRWRDDAKTDYDPCPFGWRVPKGGPEGLWNTTVKDKSFSWNYGFVGADLQSSFDLPQSEWYKATGYIQRTGEYTAEDMIAAMWSSTFSGSNAYSMSFVYTSEQISTTNKNFDSSRALGIRCVKDSVKE